MIESRAKKQAMRVRREWDLSRAGLDRFLQLLAADREEAGRIYEALRSKLIIFFRYRGCLEEETLADETFDRVIRRLNEIEIANVAAFVLGVARRVASESHKQPARHDAPAAPDPPPERTLAALDLCLDRLPAPDRDLILDYYSHSKSAKKQSKLAAAAELEISPEALRVRAFRIRRVLRECVEERLKQIEGFLTG